MQRLHGSWLALLGRQGATGGRLDDAALWLAFGIIPLVLGIGLAAMRLIRRRRVWTLVRPRLRLRLGAKDGHGQSSSSDAEGRRIQVSNRYAGHLLDPGNPPRSYGHGRGRWKATSP